MATLDIKPANDYRPYINVIINGICIAGLLDSGSAVSILGNNSHLLLFPKDFNDLDLIKDDLDFLIAAGGQRLHCLGYLNLPITFGSSVKFMKTYIIPEVNSNLILGIDFWNKFNIFPKHLGALSLESDVNKKPFSTEPIVKGFNNLSEHERDIATMVIKKFEDISFKHRGLGKTSFMIHHINTGDSKPIRQRYYRLSPEKQRIITQQVDEMLNLNVIEPCVSDWSSPVLIVSKKNGEPRFCLDSRKLNSVTIKDAYNLPYISEILDNLRDARFLSSIDLSKAFWQIPIAKEDRKKTAFYVPGKGSFQFKRTAFGLTNAPASQQRLIDLLFREFDLKVFGYLDDIILISNDFDSHVSLLLKVLEKLKQANLTINFDKCQFFRNSLNYLGYVVDNFGLRTDPKKVEAITNFPTPKNRKDLKRFLGTATWYRRFVPKFSTIAGPLNRLTSTKKSAPPFVWTPEADAAFIKLKECLVSAPVLRCPDYSKPFEVHTDASNFGIGAMLTQIIAGKEHPVAYMSRTLSPTERNYSVTERETLAVITALEHWRCYLDNGQQFTVYTDHSALKWFLSISNPTGRLARWGVRLSTFNFVMKHRKGVDNVIPDALSRALPVSDISSSSAVTTTNDSWYNKIKYGCINEPHKFPNFTLSNNKLFRLSKNKCELTNEFSWKEVINSEQRHAILEKYHSEPTAAHLGVFKTYKRISLYYYWPGLYKDVVNFVTSCNTCLAYKHQNHLTLGEMGRPKDCSRPFQMISIDIMGPLPLTRKLNSYIFVVTCCFSKYCLIFPMKRATSSIINSILEDSVFLVHGIPQTILMDNGSQFVGKSTKDLFIKYNIPKVYYTPKYTPQVNTVERYNKTIITCISTFVNNDHRSWDLLIPKINFAINNSVNESTGFTPTFLVHGRELVDCGSHYVNNEDSDEIVFLPRDKYAENLGSLASIFNKVQAALWQAHQKNLQHYNLRRKSVDLNVGDVVWKRNYFLSNKGKSFSKKLAPKFTKCTVVKKLSPLVFLLKDMNGRNLGSWHIKDIKLSNLNNS